MAHDRWDTIGGVSPEGLIDSSLELHWAVQYVAAMGQTFAEERADDSHRAMTWDAAGRMFVSVPFAGAYPFRVAVRPEDLTLMLIDRTGEALGTLPLSGKMREEGFEWLSLGMATYLGGSPPRIGRPDYSMPDHAVRSESAFSTSNEAEWKALAALYGTASDLLEEVVAGRPDGPSVQCWPHHFDIATLLTIEEGGSGKGKKKTVGVGLAPMGGGYDDWYWYVTPWPYPDDSKLRDLALGEWQTVGWTGAVLTGRSIAPLSGEEREAAVRNFLEDAIDAATESLRDG